MALPSSTKVTMTVNLDKTSSLSRQSIGNQGEDIGIEVNVDSGLAAAGYDAYVDFVQPDGLTYFKGPFDCSSGSFEFAIGVLDSLLDKDGWLHWQFLLAETEEDSRTVKWSANKYKTLIEPSIGATSSAVLPYVPQMEYPDNYPAELITIEDTFNRYSANHVEGALSEIAGSGRTTETVKGNADAHAAHLADYAFKGALLSLTSAQTIPDATFTDISFDSAIYNDGFYSSGQPTRLVIPAGVSVVRLYGMIRFPDVAYTRIALAMRQNDSFGPDLPFLDFANTQAQRLSIASGAVKVNPGDYFTLRVIQSSGASRDLNTAHTSFSIEKVR